MTQDNGTSPPEPKLDLLIKLLMLTTSANDGEALSAMRKANSLLTSRIKSDWEALIRGRVTIIEDPFNSVTMRNPAGAGGGQGGQYVHQSTYSPHPAPKAPPRPTPTPPPPPPPPDPFAGLIPIYDKRTYHVRDKIRTLYGSKYNAKSKVWYVRLSDEILVRDWIDQLPPRPRRGAASITDLAEDLGL